MNAAGIAAALGACAEAVCRRYLPRGRKQGRYWVVGDLDGAKGRSLFVRLSGPGVPGKWTDSATGQHGDLLDLIRHRSDSPTLHAALNEARALLALPVPPGTDEGDSYDAPKRPAAIGGAAAPSAVPTPRRTSMPAGSRIALFQRCVFIPNCSTATAPARAVCPRWSPPLPAMTAYSPASSALGWILRRPPRRAFLIPAKRLAEFMAAPCASALSPPASSLRFSSARELRPYSP